MVSDCCEHCNDASNSTTNGERGHFLTELVLASQGLCTTELVSELCGPFSTKHIHEQNDNLTRP
jgi:hypothetical protein